MVEKAPWLQGRLALVSGSTGILGRQIAADLAEAGADLRLVGRNAQTLGQLAQELTQQHGVKVEVALADYTGLATDDAIALVQDADILINSAAIQGPIGAAWTNDWQAWQNTIAVNMLAPALLASVAAETMRERNWGRIISISGGGATGPRPNFSAYAVAKTGLVRFSEILAAELKDTNVTVNTIAPGAFRSALTADVLAAGNDSGETELEVARHLDEATTRETVDLAAALCLFLTSEAAKDISGRLIAAKWDDWAALPDHADELASSDLFTLRRITPQDRGIGWGSK